MDAETETSQPEHPASAHLHDVAPARRGSSRASVCLVSNEIVGPFKNGGIGTATTGLAELLAAAGHRVTILYTGGIWTPDVALDPWKRHYAGIGIEFVGLTLRDMRTLAGPVRDRGFGAPALVYRFLTSRHFDVVHFNDCGGEGGLCLSAKRLGLAFESTLLVVGMHSPSQWVLESNDTRPSSPLFAAYDYAERLSTRCADLVWSPSRYLLDWAREHRFEFPARTVVQQYALPRTDGTGRPPFEESVRGHGRTWSPDEIVFFGRLEERKGLRIFCDAVHDLRDELAARGVGVTFLGKAETCARMNSLDYVRLRSKSWRFPVRTLARLGRVEALAFLRDGKKLAVMPSPVDNSPCTIYEAIDARIPFLAAKTGGIPEIVHDADHDEVLFEYTTESLRDAIRNTLEAGGWLAEFAVPRHRMQSAWLSLHENWQSFLPDNPITERVRPRVAAIVDHQHGADIQSTIESLAACESIDRIVILNRSGEDLRAVVCSVAVKTFDLPDADPAAMCAELNTLSGHAVLLIHSGVAVVPAHFERLSCRLHPDGLLPAASLVGSDPARLVPPLGGSAAFGLFEGVTFTGGMFVRGEILCAAAARGRSLALRGPFLGLADACVAGGADLWPYAEAVLELPSEPRLDVKLPLPDRIAAYASSSDAQRYWMMAFGLGTARREQRLGSPRAIALALEDRGLGLLVKLGAWAARHTRWARAILSLVGRRT